MTLYVESSNTESFTAELRVSKGSENISSQQFVIPANGSNPKVQAWFARPPKMVAGDDYLIELIVPNHQSFIAWYSDEDSYEQGRMTLNGLHAHVNGVSSVTHLCYVAAMRPYAFDFEVAEHARDQLDVNIYPNPFITEFSVNLDPKTSGIAHISVHNSQGHQLFSEEVQVEEGRTSIIHVVPSGQLTRGHYTLRVEFGDQIYVETIVKQ